MVERGHTTHHTRWQSSGRDLAPYDIPWLVERYEAQLLECGWRGYLTVGVGAVRVQPWLPSGSAPETAAEYRAATRLAFVFCPRSVFVPDSPLADPALLRITQFADPTREIVAFARWSPYDQVIVRVWPTPTVHRAAWLLVGPDVEQPYP
jgi:hypothetical protein